MAGSGIEAIAILDRSVMVGCATNTLYRGSVTKNHVTKSSKGKVVMSHPVIVVKERGGYPVEIGSQEE